MLHMPTERRLRFVSFQTRHLYAVQGLTPAQVSMAERAGEAQAFLNAGPAITAYRGPDLVACGGFLIHYPGVAEAWMMTSALAPRYGLSLFAAARELTTQMFDFARCHRIQAAVHTEFAAAIRFVERLGFVREGTMRHYGPDNTDYYLYART